MAQLENLRFLSMDQIESVRPFAPLPPLPGRLIKRKFTSTVPQKRVRVAVYCIPNSETKLKMPHDADTRMTAISLFRHSLLLMKQTRS